MCLVGEPQAALANACTYRLRLPSPEIMVKAAFLEANMLYLHSSCTFLFFMADLILGCSVTFPSGCSNSEWVSLSLYHTPPAQHDMSPHSPTQEIISSHVPRPLTLSSPLLWHHCLVTWDTFYHNIGPCMWGPLANSPHYQGLSSPVM